MAPAPGRGALENALNYTEEIAAPALLLVAENDNRQADHLRLSYDAKHALDAAERHRG